MKIALIYPKYGAAENQPNIKCVSENYGSFPPLNLAQVAGVIEKAGHEVILIDGNALNLTKEKILSLVKNFKPDLLGFTITTYLFHETRKVIHFFKENTGCKVILGGAHLSLYPKETFSYDEFDYGILGDCEESLPIILDSIQKKDLSKTKGLIYKENGKTMINLPEPNKQALDSYPFPARHLLPNERYNSFISQRKNFTGMITSRGCPYRCIFCEQGSKRFRKRSAKNIVDEMELCEKKHGVKEIDVFDSSFTIDKSRVIGVCQEYLKRDLKVKWSIRTRVDLIDEEILDNLKKAGCIRIYYGIESGNENILKNIRKCTNLDNIKKIIKLTNKKGIATFGYFMIGNPGETKDTIKQTIKFACSLNLDYAQFSKVSTLPGTELYELWKKEFKEDYWKDYVLDENKKKVMPRCNTSLSEEDIQRFVRTAYKKFYFRPRYMIKALFRIKSFKEFKRSFKAAFKMVIN